MLMMIKRSNRGKLSGSLGGKALPGMRKGVQRKRSLWSLVTAAVAIALVGLFTVGAGVSLADTPSTTDSAPEHHKTLKYKGDGTYDVTLTVQGKVESHTQTNKKPVDVIIVFDRSNSMEYGMDNDSPAGDEKRRLDYSKTAANSLIDGVFSSKNIDARVSVVDFCTYARVHTAYDTSVYAKDAAWYSNSSDAKSAIEGIRYPDNNNGGTNWQDAFRMANAISGSTFNGAPRNAERYVVFLSDGDPTNRNEYCGNDRLDVYGYYSYTRAWYWTDGTGNGVVKEDAVTSQKEADGGHRGLWRTYPYSYFGVENDLREYNFNCGVKEAKLGSGTLYCVGLTSDAAKMQEFASRLSERNATYYSATDTTSLTTAFNNIAADITGSNKSYKDVTITDTLSQWAEFPDPQNVKVTYEKATDKGTEEYAPKTPAKVDTTNKKVTWAVNDSDGDTKLDDGATYSLTFTVRPNQAAYDRALSIRNGDEEPDQGVNATGEVSPNDPAIFSNKNDDVSATGVSGTQITTITNNGSITSTPDNFRSAYAEKPVMHVPVSLVTVKKSWGESVPQDKRGDVTVVLKKKSESGDAWVNVDGTLTLNASNQWTAKKYVVAGVYSQTYEVVETDIANQSLEAFNTTYAYSGNGAETNGLTFEGRKHCDGTATINNSLKVYTLTITKKVAGNFGDTSKAFKFTLTDQNGGVLNSANVVTTGENQTSMGVKYDAKDGSFALKNNEKLVVKLPYGTAYKVVEDDPNDSNDTKYVTSISVGGTKVQANNASYTAAEGITKDTTITYTNSRTVKPEVGVDLGSGAPYVAVIGGIGIAGVIWMALKRRTSQGI